MKRMDSDRIQERLSDLSFLQNIYTYESLASTNNTARRLAAAGAPSWTLVLAEKQTAGKGQRGRTWHSAAGSGLLFSIILRPDSVVEMPWLIPTLISTEIALALQSEFQIPAKVKWPNDILSGSRKVCGILCESSSTATCLESIILGIGMNVNQDVELFPPEIVHEATSLCAITGRKLDRIHVLHTILSHLEQRLQSGLVFEQRDAELWKSTSHDLGRIMSLKVGPKVYAGRLRDFTADGFLILENENGTLQRINAGHATRLKENS